MSWWKWKSRGLNAPQPISVSRLNSPPYSAASTAMKTRMFTTIRTCVTTGRRRASRSVRSGMNMRDCRKSKSQQVNKSKPINEPRTQLASRHQSACDNTGFNPFFLPAVDQPADKVVVKGNIGPEHEQVGGG